MSRFIDAGGWLSVLIENDFYHEAGKAYFDAFLESGAKAVTSDFVLDEVITRLRYDVRHRKAKEFLGLVHEAIGAGTLEIRRIDEDLLRKAEAIFLRFADAKLSFTDCTSFALLHDDPVDEVFGFDGHCRDDGIHPPAETLMSRFCWILEKCLAITLLTPPSRCIPASIDVRLGCCGTRVRGSRPR